MRGKSLAAEVVKQLRYNTFSHPPDYTVFQLVSLDHPTLSSHVQPNQMVGIGSKQVGQKHPARRRDFGVRGESRSGIQQEYEGSNCYRREYWRSRYHVIERAGQFPRLELHAHLFRRLPNRGCQQVEILGFASTSRQGHVPGPRVAGPLSPPNEEQGIGIRN